MNDCVIGNSPRSCFTTKPCLLEVHLNYSYELTKFLSFFIVTDSPNVTLTNISSSALYANWTVLPNSTGIYKILLGYYVYFWKESDINSTFQINITNSNYILMENLEKWTTYCFNVSGYTGAGIGPSSETHCTRTMEDGR